VAELRRVSTMAFAGSEGGSASSPPLFHHPSSFFLVSGDCAS
jgi:hypothetical protein